MNTSILKSFNHTTRKTEYFIVFSNRNATILQKTSKKMAESLSKDFGLPIGS